MFVAFQKYLVCSCKTPLFEVHEQRPAHWPEFEPYQSPQQMSSPGAYEHIAAQMCVLVRVHVDVVPHYMSVCVCISYECVIDGVLRTRLLLMCAYEYASMMLANTGANIVCIHVISVFCRIC